MPLHQDFIQMSKAVRPHVLKLARQRRLVDECFKEFQRAAYPGAPADQVAGLRTAFFAGAAELLAVLLYGTSTITEEVTDADTEFFSNVSDEIERFHGSTIDAAKADKSSAN